jgi:hypothetical protein
MTATTTSLPRTENAPENLSCQTSRMTARKGYVRVVIIWDTETQPDGTVSTDELEDDAEDVEPRGVGRVVEWSSLYRVSTHCGHCRRAISPLERTSMIQRSHRAKANHQMSNASWRRALRIQPSVFTEELTATQHISRRLELPFRSTPCPPRPPRPRKARATSPRTRLSTGLKGRWGRPRHTS